MSTLSQGIKSYMIKNTYLVMAKNENLAPPTTPASYTNKNKMATRLGHPCNFPMGR